MTYKIKLHNDWNTPYFFSETLSGDTANEIVRHVEDSEYIVSKAETAKTIVKDFLDSPDTEMTLETVKLNFNEIGRKEEIPENRLIEIRDYYNGRLSIYKNLSNDISLEQAGVFHYDIPHEFNHFTTEAVDEYNETQNSAYIRVEIIN